MRAGLIAAALAVAAAAEHACNTVAECRAAVAAAATAADAKVPAVGRALRWLDDTLLAPGFAVGNSTDSKWCPSNSYFEFIPAHVATTTPADSASWLGDGCFTSMAASATFNATGASVTLSGTGATGLLCSDYYLLTTSTSLTAASVSALAPTTTVYLPFANGDDAFDANLNGINVMLLPCGLLGTVDSVLKTVNIFTSNNSAQANVDFLVDRGVWPAATPFGKQVPLDASNLRSGDYLAIARLDGLDPMIAFGTGGTTGHSAVVVFNQGVAHVVESTDANPLGPVYWPPPYGIIVHKFDDWVPLAQKAGYHVAVLPMQESISSQFNETAFWQYFSTVQGMPYGYHSMLYSFLDTWAPYANLPLPIDNQVATVVLNALDVLLPNSSAGVSGFSMLTWGLNKRMGTNCTTLACIINIVNHNKAAGKPLASLGEAMAQPDQDSWHFGANYSMVCSEFAAHAWKVGLGAALPVWQSILSNEQTPKDNYQMGLYDPARFTEAMCPGGLTQGPGGNGQYCQIMGQYVLSLNQYNTVPIYAGMNNFCPAQWPSYQRCPPGNLTCC